MFPFRREDGLGSWQEPPGHQACSPYCLCIGIHPGVGQALVPISAGNCLKQLMVLL